MIKKGDILVATSTQYFSCGMTKLHMDAIVKAANFEDTRNHTVIVYKSIEREKYDDYTRVDTERGKLRPAKPHEIEMWEAGIRNCKGEMA